MPEDPVGLLIENARFVLTQDGERNLLEEVSIAVQGDTIAAVGPAHEVAKRFKGARTPRRFGSARDAGAHQRPHPHGILF